jgi:predicted CoA-binding protein
MATKAAIEDFLARRRLAVVGVSGKRRKFGNVVLKELSSKGYEVYPVNPRAEEVDGHRCYPNLAAVADRVEGAVLVVPPAQTEKVVREAAEAGVRRIWMQQGAESDEAVRFCREQGIEPIHGECILMFADPAGFVHRLHRWLRGVVGKLPEDA